MTFAMWPLVSDLRTGAFSGGSGEEAVLAAAAVQIGKFYDLPNSVGASMSDSKIPDAQAGYEKGVTTSLAAHAGCIRV
jgi:trimethylamine--corrinoid protein Co-methyltransferase